MAEKINVGQITAKIKVGSKNGYNKNRQKFILFKAS
jgi:hypothetical protein